MGHATFQLTAPEWEAWNKEHLSHSRLVALENDEVIGWAALTPVSGRCIYSGVAEVSIYVSGQSRGKGIGMKLLAALIKKRK
jgi:phosphinothricin acetyltransferase